MIILPLLLSYLLPTPATDPFSFPTLPSPALMLPVFREPQLLGVHAMTISYPYPSYSCTLVLTVFPPIFSDDP